MANSAHFFYLSLFLICLASIPSSTARPDKETVERFYGDLASDSMRNTTGDGTIADMFDRVLEKEFSENDAPEGPDKSSFNNSVTDHQLAAVAFCLVLAWESDKLSLSLELDSFAAGVMISTNDFAQHTLDQVEAVRNLFAALFLASIGMLIHVNFLWIHVDILLASVILVIVVKTIVITTVVRAFGYNARTAIIAGLSLAQIGEFAFVLLSRASSLHLVEGKIYLLLLGTTALSLVTTPLMFKIIPAVLHLGSLLRWFPAEISSQVEEKGNTL